MIRQGDVLLRRVQALPEGALRVNRGGSIVLARGEATGHAHVVENGSVAHYLLGGLDYLAVDREATVTHEEHAPVSLAPGVWEVRRQREYDETGSVDVID